MPELAEVEVTRQALEPYLVEQRIQKLVVYEPRLRWPVPEGLPQLIRGQKVLELRRRGKYLVFKLAQGWIISHLGMSGSFQLIQTSKTKQKHDHLCFHLQGGLQLWFNDPRRFGAVLWHDDADLMNHPLLRHLGMEPFDDYFNGQYLYHMAQRRICAIKVLIMDAKVVVGVGNIYANEALYEAQLHPARAANSLSWEQYERLVQAIQRVLSQAVEQGGSSVNDFFNGAGRPGNFQHYFQVYERAGLPCYQCGTTLVNEPINRRRTVYCPQCQAKDE